ncbi:hypothetical protein SYNTR_0749 [Candidatus Syntrophocurvum alkaliphilum]|uniref:Methyltransferase domain-containing protein n=1 Tax=Candidatus Syntrophocurvum alkaliphilum TaxID=2293317 RepID=A0A6I6DE79_9FIRM|nr:nicotianamine synthase family protein [Candidatus Syntrophocurvum alkaliphilum]QGT99342.1 hypothetical protein SYNTR_0749 [Candidatus Syntrophocurvum alkaliphilum]
MLKNLFASWEKISCNFYPAFYFYHRLYRDVVQNEIKLGQITSNDKVLNIGCGAIPFTAIHIVQMTGAKVIALDKDTEAVERAKHCLKKYRLDRNIEIKIGDGVNEIPVPFTVAIVALQVKEKVKVLENLQSKGEPGGNLIFRQPTDAYKTVYGFLPNDYLPVSKTLQNMKTFKESYLYKVN